MISIRTQQQENDGSKMAKFAIAISIVLVASIAHGQKIAAREDLAVSIFHPIQLLQGWLRAELDTRLVGNDDDVFTLVEGLLSTMDSIAIRFKGRKTAMEERKKEYDTLKDTDFKNPTKGRQLFNDWYKETGELVKEFAVCVELADVKEPMLNQEKKKIIMLLESLKELSEELESCISNSGFVGFFKSIFCTIKLTFLIPLNTVTVPNMPILTYVPSKAKMVEKDMEEASCPPPMVASGDYDRLAGAGADIIARAKAAG